MCFSATASFAAGISLSAVGVMTVQKAPHKSTVLFAAIPLLFGIQQFTEGVIWNSLGNPIVLSAMAHLYLLFSHILWPTIIPLSVFLMEPKSWRQQVLGFLVGVGILVSLFFLYYLFTEPFKVEIVNQSIQYASPTFSAASIFSPYSLATCASCLFSSHRYVNIFGIAAFVGALLAYQFYQQTFVSVWCFFAALLSVIVYLYVRSENSLSLEKAQVTI